MCGNLKRRVIKKLKIVNQVSWVYYLGEDYKTLDKKKVVNGLKNNL